MGGGQVWVQTPHLTSEGKMVRCKDKAERKQPPTAKVRREAMAVLCNEALLLALPCFGPSFGPKSLPNINASTCHPIHRQLLRAKAALGEGSFIKFQMVAFMRINSRTSPFCRSGKRGIDRGLSRQGQVFDAETEYTTKNGIIRRGEGLSSGNVNNGGGYSSKD